MSVPGSRSVTGSDLEGLYNNDVKLLFPWLGNVCGAGPAIDSTHRADQLALHLRADDRAFLRLSNNMKLDLGYRYSKVNSGTGNSSFDAANARTPVPPATRLATTWDTPPQRGAYYLEG
jgi:hypothetical protein